MIGPRADRRANPLRFYAVLEAVVTLELCDTRLQDWEDASALWRLADQQSNAALVLGNRRDLSAAPALRRLTGDSDPVVRQAAAWALERLTYG